MPDEGVRGGGLMALSAADAVAPGAVTRAELDGLFADLDAAVDRGDAFVAVTMFAAVGRRPG